MGLFWNASFFKITSWKCSSPKLLSVVSLSYSDTFCCPLVPSIRSISSNAQLNSFWAPSWLPDKPWKVRDLCALLLNWGRMNWHTISFSNQEMQIVSQKELEDLASPLPTSFTSLLGRPTLHFEKHDSRCCAHTKSIHQAPHYSNFYYRLSFQFVYLWVWIPYGFAILKEFSI